MPPLPADNLARLTHELGHARAAAGLSADIPAVCSALAERLPLTHGVTTEVFFSIAEDRFSAGTNLLSARRFSQISGETPRTDNAEAALNTQDAVFLFCGQFRYPKGQAGFLFQRALEDHRSADTVATPFDSGGLHLHFSGPDLAESPQAFLARHTLPVPAYRPHLAERLHFLFAEPQHYVTRAQPPIRPDPVGLRPKYPGIPIGPRQWTFEVRIRDQVPLAAPHLAAVFYSPRMQGNRFVRRFLAGLRQQQIDVKPVQPIADGDFAALQRQCVDYLRERAIL